ncbi:MAG: hypothetical protein RIB61_06985 [Roseicyclus sp.]|jgi:hypothetical protein
MAKPAALVKLGICLVLVGATAGCGIGRDRGPQVVGLPFNARLDTGETFRDFTVAVEAGGASLEDARESARFPATRHCTDRTGDSSVEWVMDAATGDWAFSRTEDGDLIVSGQCVGR